MLFRILARVFSVKSTMDFYFCFICDKISIIEKEYRKFLIYVIKLLIFKPLVKVFNFIFINLTLIFFIIQILSKALAIFLRLIFIIYPLNSFYFFYLFLKPDHQYLCIEFVIMFFDSYILFLKYKLKCILLYIKHAIIDLFEDIINYSDHLYLKYFYSIDNTKIYRPITVNKTKLYGSFAVEYESWEYEEYKNNFQKVPAPDLQVYYPMRFAMASVMIRITGVVLAVCLLLILIFNFTNIFIIGDGNFHEFRRSLQYKFVQFVQRGVFDHIKYGDFEKYNTSTYWSTVKLVSIIFFTFARVCLNYLIFDAYIRFELVEIFKFKYLILNFFYNFFIYVFIYTLPLHLYYVVYHSYKIIYITTYIGRFIDFLKEGIKRFIQFLVPLLKRFWNFAYLVATIEEPPVDDKKYAIMKDKFIKELKEKIKKFDF